MNSLAHVNSRVAAKFALTPLASLRQLNTLFNGILACLLQLDVCLVL